MNNKLLVVGGGFIGVHIADEAVSRGWSVTIIRFTSNDSNGFHPSITIIKADITDLDDLNENLKDIDYDYVINCGGYIDHTLFIDGGRKVIDSHFGGVLNLVSLLNRKRLRSFINLGSSDEYGNIPAPQKENDLEVPISPYSVGKLAAARFLQMLFLTEKFPSTTLRLFLVYGPRQESKRFLPYLIKGCLQNNVIPVSDGMQIRDFLFINDLVDAVFKVFTNEAARGEILNIASGKPVTIREVISKIQFKIQQGDPLFGKIPYRLGENMNLHASVGKAKRILNWFPTTSLDTGLDITISYYRELE
jgi:nucleoside-diphosphate-sugar epimerase